jgi:hypothetical protein
VFRLGFVMWLLRLLGFFLFLLVWTAGVRAEPAEEPSRGEIVRASLERLSERHEAAVEAAEEIYRRAVEQAAARGNQDVFLQRANVDYRQRMTATTEELLSELARVEPWVGDQLPLLEKIREAAQERLAHALAPYLTGKWHLVVNGEGELYLNGRLVVATDRAARLWDLSPDVRLKRGDFVVIRVQSPFVNRAFRTAFVGSDGRVIPVVAEDVRRFADLDPTTISREMARSGGAVADRGRMAQGGIDRWNGLGIDAAESDWIRLPTSGRWHVYAFIVP